MIGRIGFILGEVWAGIRSSVGMVISIILVTFVSMSFVGIAALLQMQVEELRSYWFDRAQVVVYMCTDYSSELICPSGAATEEQIASVEAQLNSQALKPYVSDFYFEDHAAAYAKFSEEFADSPTLAFIQPEQLNQAFWITLADSERSDVILEAFSGAPGVEEVRDQRGYLDGIFSALNFASIAAASIATVMLASAALLISSTIRLSAFSRRREIVIMRLVGSDQFSIQLPFILEGVIAAGIGSLLAIAGNWFLVDQVITQGLGPELPFSALVTTDAVVAVAPYLIAGGVILASLASGISIRRYLRS